MEYFSAICKWVSYWYTWQHRWIMKAFCCLKEAGLDAKSYIWYDFITMTLWKMENFRDRNNISGCWGLAVRTGRIIKRYEKTIQFSSVQFSHSVVSDSLRPHESQHARPPCPSPTPGVYPMPIKSVMPSSHLILCHPLLLLPTIPPSIRVFSSESTLHMRWPEYWSFSFSISPSNEHPGLISFRMDWLYLLAVQGTLKTLLQYHSSKASIFRRSAFFTVQLSHPYMTTETIRMGKMFSILIDYSSSFVTLALSS